MAFFQYTIDTAIVTPTSTDKYSPEPIVDLNLGISQGKKGLVRAL